MSVLVAAPDVDRCPCDRMDKPAYSWLCRCCFLEKEVAYALSELDRGGDAWEGTSWRDMARWRLGRLLR